MAFSYESKKQIVESILVGKSYQESINDAQIRASERSVYRWVDRYNEEGDRGLREGRRGVVWKVTDEIRAWLVECCEEAPWLSARQLQAQLQETFGVVVSLSHINQIRIDEGVSKAIILPKKRSDS